MPQCLTLQFVAPLNTFDGGDQSLIDRCGDSVFLPQANGAAEEATHGASAGYSNTHRLEGGATGGRAAVNGNDGAGGVGG